MSGPIVRKYGFPNFEKIFGERNMEHGTDEAEGETTEATPTTKASANSEQRPAAKTDEKKA